jgi:hypothetical protein
VVAHLKAVLDQLALDIHQDPFPLLFPEGLCQLSRHHGKTGSMDRSDLGYAVAIRPINWVNRA